MANLISRTVFTGTLAGSDIFYGITDPGGTPAEWKIPLSKLTALYATAAQGVTADSAVQPGDLALVATTGDYDDLSGTPTLGTLAALNSPLPVANGGTAGTTAGDARTNLGLGTIATQAANNVSISGGSITGITDLAIADGGTGQSTAQAAINALTAVSGATNEHVLTKDTATGNAVFKAAAGGSSLPVADTQTIVMGSADNTKLLRFEVDGFTAGTTRVLTPPNANATIAGLEVANVFTAAQTQQGSGTQVLTLRSTNGQAHFNIISQAAGGGDWLLGTGSGSGLGVDALYFYSQAPSAGFRLWIDGAGVVAVPGTLAVGGTTLASGTSAYINCSGTPGRVGINHSTNTGIGFYIAAASKWSAAAYLPAGTNYSFVFYNDQTNVNSLFLNGDDDNVIFGSPSSGGSLATYARINAYTRDSTTNAIKNEIAMVVDSSGTPAAGFGGALRAILKSSTTIGQDVGRLSWEWATATHASRKALSKWTVYDTAEREGLRIEASGSAPMLGVLGAAAIARQAHIADPSGGGTVDAEARTAINAILVALESFGFLATS